ncbi:hypothetical protein bas09_0061 [Changchunvirus paulsarasin]|uniref:Uncharacterized protein n=1 Tax=Escherichia phage PaulSarasin TaxID=2851973 RepID=A0AAE7VXS8_9CAUD|nr:hypothetical protein bas09_0061 [Escherichia phage PaulSarasin]
MLSSLFHFIADEFQHLAQENLVANSRWQFLFNFLREVNVAMPG